MAFDALNKINEISGSLADATTAAEELQNERPEGLDAAILARLLRTFEDARLLVSQLEDQSEDGNDTSG
ncbi:MAG TPA: hypothetical protein VGL62_01350 [Vicinamibacterales bacterium]|jgi:hypothetical protein